MINDAAIRQYMIQALPLVIDPGKLEVAMTDYDYTAAYWYRAEMGTLHGKTVALHKDEKAIAADLASDLSALLIADTVNGIEVSPYEGKAGRHPDNCTCSTHAKVLNGQAH